MEGLIKARSIGKLAAAAASTQRTAAAAEALAQQCSRPGCCCTSGIPAHQAIQACARQAQLRGRHLQAAAADRSLARGTVTPQLGSHCGVQPIKRTHPPALCANASPLLPHIDERLLKRQLLGAMRLLQRLYFSKVLQRANGRHQPLRRSWAHICW